MTNELLDLLRFKRLDSRNCDEEACCCLMATAADEIEKLQKELDAVTKDRDDLQEKYNESVLSK